MTLDPSATPDEIRADIDQARADLSEAVSQLGEKLDVKAQAHHKADAVKEKVQDSAHKTYEAAPQPVQRGLQQARPVIDLIRPYSKQVGLVILLLLVLRRVRSR